MILTVTLNTAIDWTLLVPSFVWNETLRAEENGWGMGGKPTDASWILGELEIPNVAMGFSAGIVGQKFEAMLQAKGVKTDFVHVDGETRLNVHLINKEDNYQSTIVADTLIVSARHEKQLLEKYEAALEFSGALIIGGSQPKCMTRDLLGEMIEMAHLRKIPIALDTSGKFLLSAVRKHPDVIKPNRTELSVLAGKPIATLEEAYQAARAVYKQYGCQVVATMGGGMSALAVLKDRSYLIPNLKVEKVVSTAGAGDGVLAGIGYALAEGKPLEEGLRLGFAAAAAIITNLRTADCKKEDVYANLPKVQLIPYP